MISSLNARLSLVLVLLQAGCSDGGGGVSSEPVVGDFSPLELSQQSISLDGFTESVSKATPISEENIFVAAKTGDVQVSNSMTYRFNPGEAEQRFEIPIQNEIGAVVEVRVYESSKEYGAVLDGVILLDSNGQSMSTETQNTEIVESSLEASNPTFAPASGQIGRYFSKRFALNANDELGRTRAKLFTIHFPEVTRSHLIEVSVEQPSTTLTLGAVVETRTYQPGAQVRVDFELIDEEAPPVELKNVDVQVNLGHEQLSSTPKVVLIDERHGYLTVDLPMKAKSGTAELRVIATGERQGQRVHRDAIVGFDVVRPHAEIFDLHERIGKGKLGPQFEVDVTVRSTTPDRFKVYGILTGRSEAGYEVPVARADVAFDAIETGLTLGTLVFDLASVRGSQFTGPFSLRDVVLTSLYTGGEQHRIGLVEGVETPLKWGLAGNQGLRAAMCEVLIDAGELQLGDCRVAE